MIIMLIVIYYLVLLYVYFIQIERWKLMQFSSVTFNVLPLMNPLEQPIWMLKQNLWITFVFLQDFSSGLCTKYSYWTQHKHRNK